MNGIECEEAVKDICENVLKSMKRCMVKSPLTVPSEPLATKIVQQLKF